MHRLAIRLFGNMGNRDSYSRRHVLPGDPDQAGRRCTVPRNTQSHHVCTLVVERLTHASQAIRGIGHSMQQQHRSAGFVHRQLKTVVPVLRPLIRIGQAAPVIPGDLPFVTVRNPGVDLLVQFFEQPVLQLKVLSECRNFGIGGKFFVQIDRMPDTQIRPVVHDDDEHRHQGYKHAQGAVNPHQ